MASTIVIRDGLHTGADPATPTVGVVSAEDARLSNAATFARSTTGLGVRTGVLYHGVTALLAATATTAPSMTVTVAPLAIVGQKAAGEGVYVPVSVATAIIDIAAAPGSNSRVDVIFAMQRDAGSATSPDTLTQGEVGVVTGTAAVSPTKPAIPVGAVEIGTVTVAAGATATTNGTVTIATTCRWTVPLGSPVPVRNTTERAALTQYDGLLVNRLDTNVLERSDGAAWYAIGDRPAYGRIRNPANIAGFGSGVWTRMSGWIPDVGFKGASAGVLQWNTAGVVSIQVTGLYRLTLQVAAQITTPSGGLRVKLINTVDNTVYVEGAGSGPQWYMVAASTEVWLSAGVGIAAYVYNETGVVTIKADSGDDYGVTGWTISHVPGF